jgi:type IV pilus assembly protein PilX
MQATNRLKPQQQGIALIVVLLILVVVSLLGIGGAQLAMMGERGARNERDTQIARQYAEVALLDAEFDIRGPGTSKRKDFFNSEINFADGCGTVDKQRGLCAQSLTGKPVWLTVDFLSTSATPPFTTVGDQTDRKITNLGNGIQPALAPRYIVEVIPDNSAAGERGLKAPKKILHRITAMGFGPQKDIQTVLQMVFRKEQS